jgi:hypothetical protein
VEENLEVLDVKLKHMRGDISAIESSNNLLELQSRNNQRLLKTLGATIDDLKIPQDVKALLEDPDFDIDK